MLGRVRHIPPRFSARCALAVLALGAVAACSGEDDAALRDRLDRWFAIGDTVEFHSQSSCMAAAYRLVQFEVKSPLSVAGSVPEALRSLERRGAFALKDPDQAPDAALMEMVEYDRTTGMTIRRAALEGRLCMGETTESAFRYALENPGSMLAYDAESANLMLLDPRTGLLVVARGAQEWF